MGVGVRNALLRFVFVKLAADATTGSAKRSREDSNATQTAARRSPKQLFREL
jgi:hypothetical protein